ncbi:hypothetical protein Tco_0581594 [Tanacetum coccineum]|uniref:Uncharacterized protein n=1 Tax=Tanacetum coccineum TaxID=301880 RepID=A0ABQ5FP99_9ASTR
MQPLTPQTVHIAPSGDDYVAPATNPMSNKQLNKFEEEFSNITKGSEKEYDNPVIDTYDCENFIWKLLHQVSQSSREMKSQQQYGSNLSFPSAFWTTAFVSLESYSADVIEYFEPTSVVRLVPHVLVAQVPVSLDQDAPSGSHSPSSSDHQSSSVHQGVAADHSFEVNPFAPANHEPFVNVFAPDPSSEAFNI